MSAWGWAATVLVAFGLVPALAAACRGDVPARLAGLAAAGPVAVLTLLALAQDSGQSAQFVVPLVLAALSFTGTVMIARLVGDRR